jgi:ABC-2 type transport system ATP-binding protein
MIEKQNNSYSYITLCRLELFLDLFKNIMESLYCMLENKLSPIMIKIENLTKRFGNLVAVNNLSISANKGDVLALLGPNGAGKTTTMNMITGYLAPTSGKITVCGNDISEFPKDIKSLIGFLPEGAPSYDDETPLRFLDFIASIRGYKDKEKKQRIERAIQLADIKDVINQPIETLSKGYKRRVGLAQSILHNPEVLILDEPTDGLDPNQKRHVRKLIREMSKEKAIVISTHSLEEVEAICNKVCIIAKGVLKFDGSIEKLKEQGGNLDDIFKKITLSVGEK